MSIKVEIFSSPGCNICNRASLVIQKLAQEIAQEMFQKTGENKIQLKKVNIIEEIDRAVALGILSTPAIAIDNVLVFTGLPSEKKLRKVLLNKLSANAQDITDD